MWWLLNIADRNQLVEFYDFLQVNTDSNRSEVTDNARREDEEVNQDAVGQENKDNGVPFIDFLSVGSSWLDRVHKNHLAICMNFKPDFTTNTHL